MQTSSPAGTITRQACSSLYRRGSWCTSLAASCSSRDAGEPTASCTQSPHTQTTPQDTPPEGHTSCRTASRVVYQRGLPLFFSCLGDLLAVSTRNILVPLEWRQHDGVAPATMAGQSHLNCQRASTHACCHQQLSSSRGTFILHCGCSLRKVENKGR